MVDDIDDSVDKVAVKMRQDILPNTHSSANFQTYWSVPRSCGTPLAGHVCEPDQQVQSRVQGMVCECGSLIHLVLDVPDMDYLYSLETREKLLTLDNLKTVFHFSPHEVITRYKQWLEMLRDNVSHIMLNECTS